MTHKTRQLRPACLTLGQVKVDNLHPQHVCNRLQPIIFMRLICVFFVCPSQVRQIG